MKKRLLFILVLSFFVLAPVSAQTRRATKTVTNADLEKYRQKRLQSEREYRDNYEKLGFPSPEELQRQREQSRAANEQAIVRQREKRLQNESDYTEQADVLRAEIASVEAQINYVRSLFPANQPPTSYFTGGVAPFGYARGGQSNSVWRGDATGRVFFGGRVYTPNPRSVYGSVQPFPLNENFYGRNQIRNGSGIRVNIGVGNGRLRSRYGNYGNYRYDYRRQPVFGYYAPVIADRYDYTQDELVNQLRLLEQQRAGLYAEWRLLQEKAKRAGVKIN
ncbi:MAG TPA: hypothetical protein VF556_03770 [Pyrinomonadaceae bacterium]|jgi:hypothetical protein